MNGIYTDRDQKRQADRWTDKRGRYRHTDRQTDRWDKNRYRQRGRQKDR